MMMATVDVPKYKNGVLREIKIFLWAGDSMIPLIKEKTLYN